ncbi:MAG: hypothetical protein E5W28_06850 [Mesorhizobium sp.]|uniref:hypothetical protein n=1 Tax=Mesorhizobium sp. TaxID=1871066 RepID=UPI000FE6FEC7|nr:hypothetical protein [Mesorhizobium sp.]RWE83473.1 MAG: hypothetical protein EOS63_04940 [Mesorhizobium sp.]TIU37765.1 MAG: hypothetical protein E5W28_06850 [Mesorhizobium sp.]TJW61347.1 MAG: hypothetical protein E5V97_20840 [Mesorhizobium sp.]
MKDHTTQKRKYTRYASKEEAEAARKAYMREYQKTYQRKDTEQRAAIARERYFNEPEPQRDYGRERYRSDPEHAAKVRETGKAWRKANPDKVLAYRREAAVNRKIGRSLRVWPVSREVVDMG